MITGYPKNRRKFLGGWDQILYLYDKILYWFYSRHRRSEALRFSVKLERLLRIHAPGHVAVKGEECWSLIYEIKGNLRKAIKYREKEIQLIRRLQRIGQGTDGYGAGDLADRLDLLAILYDDAGDTGRAIKVLRQSQKICLCAGVPFDGKDLLEDFQRVVKKK